MREFEMSGDIAADCMCEARLLLEHSRLQIPISFLD